MCRHPRASVTCRFRAAESLAEQTLAGPGQGRNLPSVTSGTCSRTTNHRSRASKCSLAPVPLHRAFSLVHVKYSRKLFLVHPRSNHTQDPEILHLLNVPYCLFPSVSPLARTFLKFRDDVSWMSVSCQCVKRCLTRHQLVHPSTSECLFLGIPVLLFPVGMWPGSDAASASAHPWSCISL